MEVAKRQQGRSIPFYFTITPEQYTEMQKADREIEEQEKEGRKIAWKKHKESRAPAGTRNAASKNTLSIF